MAISIKQLIFAAPFSEEKRRALLENLDKLNDDQKFKLVSITWSLLAQMYFAKLKAEYDRMQEEMIYEEKSYTANDFEEAKAKILHEFIQRFENAKSKEEIAEVRKQLERFSPQPPSITNENS